MLKKILPLLITLMPITSMGQKPLPEKMEPYFTLASSEAAAPDGDGFLRRWLLLEPISKPNRTNTVFTDSYLREAFAKEYFKGQFTDVPKAGSKVKLTIPASVEPEPQPGAPIRLSDAKADDSKPRKVTLTWHALDSKLYNVKLFRFATGMDKQEYGVLFLAVTVIDSPEDMADVRLAVGSNSASIWWIDGEEAVLLSGDRRMVKDDCLSQRLTLRKGRHIVRGAVINGPGMSDFCVRFLDKDGRPVTKLTTPSLADAKGEVAGVAFSNGDEEAAALPVRKGGEGGTAFMHDPSTIAYSNGRYFTYGTGENGWMSEDGWTWRTGAIRPGRGAAPDVIKIGDRYLVAWSATGGGLGGSHAGRVLTMWNKTLDPSHPDFKYTEPVEVATSEDGDDCDAIDAGLLLDPTTGRLWLSYGTYFGFIRLVELDPKTGRRMEGNQAVNIAIDCEATDLIYRNGWYYLLGTHGTCCDGPNSTYNIVVGRSRQVTGPYLDNMGRDMLQGGGKMVIAARDGYAGPGHFGRYVEDDGVERMSCHFEADFAQGGRSVLAILPLLWKEDWPVAGYPVKEGTYEIESERRGYALELAVDFVRMDYKRHRFWEPATEPVEPLKAQTLQEVIATWPEGQIPVRAGDYMFRPHQKWTITAVPEAGGHLGIPYCKIEIAGTKRALAATASADVTTVPDFTSAPEQLWLIEQCTDGTYRISPKQVPGTTRHLVLASVGDSTPSLVEWDYGSDNCKWNLRTY